MITHSFNTPLKGRILWYDGESSYCADDILSVMQTCDVRYVDTITQDIADYNKLCSQSKITVKNDCGPLTYSWNIPEEYKNLCVEDYVYEKLYASKTLWSEGEFKRREQRLVNELIMFKKYKLYDVLRCVIYVINTLTLRNVVWGIGRGSSVSSYILYLVGVHDVDSFLYELDINDFLHD